ncbi:MAG TPA: hypothetical protein VMD27_03600 [Candidatus Aquilonibacter sp.]|nr:hypothetical protein [Candidatus Aquilonibacter sp.]
MVRIAGLEPEFAGFSVLLIGAILCDCLQSVKHKKYIVCNIIIAIMSSFEKIFLCVFVRRLQVCAQTVRKNFRAKSVRNLCGQVAHSFRTKPEIPLAIPRNPNLMPHLPLPHC